MALEISGNRAHRVFNFHFDRGVQPKGPKKGGLVEQISATFGGLRNRFFDDYTACRTDFSKLGILNIILGNCVVFFFFG